HLSIIIPRSYTYPHLCISGTAHHRDLHSFPTRRSSDLVGFFVANLLDQWIRKYANSPFSASIVKYVVIVFAVFMTLDQLQFAKTIVNTGFLLVLGGLMIAFALSFGLGGRDFAKEQ